MTGLERVVKQRHVTTDLLLLGFHAGLDLWQALVKGLGGGDVVGILLLGDFPLAQDGEGGFGVEFLATLVAAHPGRIARGGPRHTRTSAQNPPELAPHEPQQKIFPRGAPGPVFSPATAILELGGWKPARRQMAVDASELR